MPKTSNLPAERLFFLDLARAVAIGFVTAFHIWRFFGQTEANLGPLALHSVASAGFIGVDVFFVISGYAMMLTWRRISQMPGRRYGRFLLARLKRIYPAYGIAILFWCLVATTGIVPREITVFDVVTHLTMTHTLFREAFFSISGVFWTLAVEAHFYLLFPLLVSMTLPFRLAVAVASGLFAVLVTVAATIPELDRFVWRWNVLAYLPLFLLGMALFFMRAKGVRLGASVVAAIVILVLMAMMIAAPDDQNMVGRSLVATGIAVPLLLWEPRMPRIVQTAISIVGQASYSIYLYNYVFLCFRPPVFGGASGTAVYAAGVVLFGILAWLLVERPIAKVLRGPFDAGAAKRTSE